MQVELNRIALSTAFILYRFFSNFLIKDFTSVGRVERRFPMLSSAGLLVGRVAGFLAGVRMGVLVELTDVSLARSSMITEDELMMEGKEGVFIYGVCRWRDSLGPIDALIHVIWITGGFSGLWSHCWAWLTGGRGEEGGKKKGFIGPVDGGLFLKYV